MIPPGCLLVLVERRFDQVFSALSRMGRAPNPKAAFGFYLRTFSGLLSPGSTAITRSGDPVTRTHEYPIVRKTAPE
ncbi:hypothetical protein ACVDG3_19105 [Meridianimarinicoccus sp. RP-17]